MATQRAIQTEPLSFVATAAKGKVSGLLWRPDDARWLLVFGHGAGAGMRHRFMHEVSACLAAAGIATLRYQFPYMEAGSRRPDAAPDSARYGARRRRCRQRSRSRPPAARRRQVDGRAHDFARRRRGGAAGRAWAGLLRLSPPSRGPAVDRARRRIWSGSICPCCSSRANATGLRSWTCCGRSAPGSTHAPPCTWCRPRTTASTCCGARVAAMPTCSGTSPTRLPNGPPRSPSAIACEVRVPTALHSEICAP